MVVRTAIEKPVSPEQDYIVKESLKMAGFHPRPFERGGIVVLYGEEPGGRELARSGFTVVSVFRDRDLYELPASGHPRILGGIPFWGRMESGELWGPETLGRGAYLRMKADVFGNLFQLLARPEEWGRDPFPPDRSFLEGWLDRPIGDMYIRLLREAVGRACEVAGRPYIWMDFWPRGEPSAAFLSHDVDRVRKWTPKRVGYELLRAFPMPRRVMKVLRSLRDSRDPYWNFPELMAVEEDAGVRSTFFFGVGRYDRRDPSYELYQVEGAVRELLEGGWEVGLHGSMGSYKDAGRLREERDKLGALAGEVQGIRQHYLRLAVPETWRAQEEAGFLYDATLGYSRKEGFRAGTSLPFFPFDPEQGEAMDILAVPLGIMDTTLTTFRNYGRREAFEVVGHFIEEVGRFGGVFSLLVHQRALDGEEFPYVGPLYLKVLLELKDRGAYVAKGMDLAGWWRARAGLEAEERREGEGWCWRIEAREALPGLSLRLGPGLWEVRGEGVQIRASQDGDGIWVRVGPVQAGGVFSLYARRVG